MDNINEMNELAQYLEKLNCMNEAELNYELRKYLYTVNTLESMFSTHRALLLSLKTYIERGMLNSNFNYDINKCIEEAIYEKSYLNNFSYIIKKMLKTKKYFDVELIYMDIVYLNYINYCRGEYINSLYKLTLSGGNIDTIYKIDNSDIIHDISCSTNILFKKLRGIK